MEYLGPVQLNIDHDISDYRRPFGTPLADVFDHTEFTSVMEYPLYFDIANQDQEQGSARITVYADPPVSFF